MVQRIIILLAEAGIVLSCGRPATVLERGGWDEAVYERLCNLLENAPEHAYAVFDCDNTSIRHDVSICLMIYQIENLRFASAQASRFLSGIEDTAIPLAGLGGMTAADMGSALAREYEGLESLLEEGLSLDTVRTTPLYLDFRAQFLAFYEAIAEEYDYGTFCLWMPALLEGMTTEEAAALGRESLDYWLSFGKVWDETWISPDGTFQATAEKGLVVPQDMKNLYRALDRRGIDVYICSASAEWLVELLACDPDQGFGLPPEHVFGIRLATGKQVIPRYREGYVQPYMEGKVDCIRRLIAPGHSPGTPLLVGGDSQGDLAMLTEWPDLPVGLIMDRGQQGAIRELADSPDPRFLCQPVTPVQE